MKVYRIYTEQKNLKWICQVVSEKFPGFTVYKTVGYWQGKPEKSVMIEIIAGNMDGAEYYIRQLCLKIKGYNCQAEVLYTKQELRSEIMS